MFYIYKSPTYSAGNDGTLGLYINNWKISFAQEGVRLGEDRELLFYATRNSGGDKLPPVNDWQSTCGKFPVPTFEFVFLTSI